MASTEQRAREEGAETPVKTSALRKVADIFASINYWRLGIAMFFSIVLWFTANYESDLEKEVEIPIHYINLPGNLVISNKPYLPNYVKLRVKGTRSQLSAVAKTNVAIDIDLADSGTGLKSHKIDPESIQLPRNVQIVSISPRKVGLDIDMILEKFSPVKLDMGQPGPGYKIDGEIKVKPSTVKIKGPNKIVRDINEVMTVPIDIEKEKSSLSVDVRLLSPDSRAEFSEADTVKVTVNIVELSLEKTFRSLEVEMRNVPKRGKYKLETQKADIKFHGPRSLINSLNSDDIKIYVNARAAGSLRQGGTKTFTLYADYPHGEQIQLISIEPQNAGIKREREEKKEEGK